MLISEYLQHFRVTSFKFSIKVKTNQLQTSCTIQIFLTLSLKQITDFIKEASYQLKDNPVNTRQARIVLIRREGGKVTKIMCVREKESTLAIQLRYYNNIIIISARRYSAIVNYPCCRVAWNLRHSPPLRKTLSWCRLQGIVEYVVRSRHYDRIRLLNEYDGRMDTKNMDYIDNYYDD